jgi:RNA polymerase sigma-70 factor (ECF subfamily)
MGLAWPASAGAVSTEKPALHAEDRALVARMLEGDELALTELVERYSSALFRFSLSRLGGNRELARETVQTALTKALTRLDTYRGESSLLTWLCACCRNEILMHLRKLRTAPLQVELDDDVQPAVGSPSRRDPDPETNLLRVETSHLVHITLDLLPPRYSQALEWKYVDQLPVDEIAVRLGLRAKAAESLLTRARKAFRAAYHRVLSDTAVESATSPHSKSELEDSRRERARHQP